MLRYAALGDSITLGMGDPVPGGGWRGWAGLLAHSLGSDLEFRNFAASGALTADVLATQLPAARAWQPHLATVVVGVNDVLRGNFDLGLVGHRLHGTVASLSELGTRTVTACLPEPGRMLRLPASLALPLGRRIRAVNDIVHAVSDAYRADHVHLSEDPVVYDRRMWSIDRLHPSERGHRRLAIMFHDTLAASGWPVGAPPDPEPSNPPPTPLAQAWWMATKGSRWLLRRSTDLVPDLLRLAGAEWRLRSRGLPASHAPEVAALLHTLGLAAARPTAPQQRPI